MVEWRHRALKAPIIPIICEATTLRNLLRLNLLGLFFASAFAPASVTAQQIALDPGVPVTLIIAGLHDSVTVRRDVRGIPYIEAKNNDDLYFAQGYVTASERLWQMDLLRRNARGELAEIFGPAALEQDKLHRRYGFGRVADAMVSKASLEAKSTLEAYAR